MYTIKKRMKHKDITPETPTQLFFQMLDIPENWSSYMYKSYRQEQLCVNPHFKENDS